MVKEMMELIAKADPEVGAGIWEEFERQRRNIELIASRTLSASLCWLPWAQC